MSKINVICYFILFFAFSNLYAQWEADVRLTNDPGESRTSFSPGRCCAAIGITVHVVWADDRTDGTEEIFHKRSTDNGTTWSADTRLSTSNPMRFSDYPAIAVLGNYVHVVWHDDRDAGTPEWEIYYKRSTDNGVTWGTDTRLTNASSASYYAAISVSDSNVHVVWYDYRDGNFEIYYKNSTDNGFSWNADTRLTNNISISENPTIVCSGSYVHVTWFDERDGNCEIYHKRSMDNGVTWGADTRLTNDAANSYYTSLATAGNDVHLVWYDNRDGNYEIYYKKSTDNGSTWGADTRLTNNSSASMEPSLAASASMLHLTWEDQRDGNYEVYYKRSTDAGLTWQADTRLTAATLTSHKSTVALSGSYVHTVWTDFRDNNMEIYYKRNPTGNVEVKEHNKLPISYTELIAYPNPFTAYTIIKGCENDQLTVFNVSGRMIKEYSGSRIGADLPAGVYFVTLRGKNTAPLRILRIK